MVFLLRASQKFLDGRNKCLSHCNSPGCVSLGHMPGIAVISDAAQFKKPVQIFAVLFIQLAGFNKELVKGRNDAAVFLVLPALA